jgi:Stage II sporulation protein M
MDVSQTALAQGMADTRTTLRRWRAARYDVVGEWLAASVIVAAALLSAVWLIATVSTPADVAIRNPARVGTINDAVSILGRNALVLALHAFACIAGFIAGSSLPLQAQEKHGIWRDIHDRAGRLAILFVIGATCFSLGAQSYVLGHVASTVAARLHVSPGLLLIALLPHAIPELAALFLPLAAWIIASRRGRWHELLAATAVTVAVAVPVLVLAALVEVYVSPHLVAALLM